MDIDQMEDYLLLTIYIMFACTIIIVVFLLVKLLTIDRLHKVENIEYRQELEIDEDVEK